MQKIKWFTESEYVDSHTGEMLDALTAKANYRVKEKIIKYYTKTIYGTEYRIKRITNICTNEGTQRKFNFD